MKIRNLVVAALTVLFIGVSVFAEGASREELVVLAVSSDVSSANEAIRSLRTLGQSGLDALFEKYKTEIDRFTKTGEADENWKRIANAIDSVAMQKDAYASQLFWYTNFDEAKQIAKEKNKPILTLRLLGNLNEEFSCANSRLFRAVLYPNAEVSKYLRENYILHWQSVRPAPKVTIDFGDGRRIERTLTGNSIHYILSEDGDIIDALPGLYSPKTFLKYLTKGRQVSSIVDGLAKADKGEALMKYQKLSFDEIKLKRDKSVAIAKVKLTEPKDTTAAIDVQLRAMTKAVMINEVSILRVYDDFAKFEPQINFDDWNKLAKLYSPSQKLDASSTAFVRRQNAKTGLTEAELNGLFSKLENFIALDTTRNDFLYHMKLYQWLNNDGTGDVDQLNTRVYADIFKTPNTDKWLGLYSPDIYTALDGNGFVDNQYR